MDLEQRGGTVIRGRARLGAGVEEARQNDSPTLGRNLASNITFSHDFGQIFAREVPAADDSAAVAHGSSSPFLRFSPPSSLSF